MTQYVLGDDQPKENPWQHDRLGYAPFAKRIFKVIVSYPAPNGYVIGVHGQWGSGKSTILKFVKSYFEKHNEENPHDRVQFIEFQPWIVSGHQDLIVAFFKLLSEALGPNENRWVRAFRRFIRLSYGATDKLVDAAATVAVTIDPSAGAASGFAGILAKKSMNGYLRRFIEEKSLQQAYQELQESLRESGKRFVVTIDDIDRLEDDEVRSIMQMVKTVGRLPNVVYLLSYDRTIVSRILDNAVADGHPRFSEKITQQEIALPPPSRNALLSMLDAEISFLAEGIENNNRWFNLLRYGIHRWIKRPRDVLRLSNAVKWAWPALEGNFDGSDLLTMEGIRLFEPAAFAWVQTNRDFLFNQGEYIIGAEAKRNENVASLKGLMAAASVEPVMSLLAILFPHQGKWFEGGFASYQETYVDSQNRRGMASAAHYDSYFALQLSPDAIPASIVSQILSSADPAMVEALVRPYLDKRSTGGTEMITILIRELRYRLEEGNAPAPKLALLEGFFAIGEPVAAMPWPGGFEATPGAELSWLVSDILKKWGPDRADKRLLEAFDRCSVAFASEIYLYVGRAKGVLDKDGKGLEFIKNETFDTMGEILLQRTRIASGNGTLLTSLVLDGVVRAWKRLAGFEEPRKWISENLRRNGHLAAKVARTAMSESLSSDGRVFRMYPKADKELFDIQAMIDAARAFSDAPELSSDERAILDEVLRAGPLVLKGEYTDGLE